MKENRGSTSTPADFDGADLKHDLKGRSVRGGAVTFASQGVRFVVTLGSTVVLARLLSPADFGLVAMVYTITTLVELLRNMGLSAATVQAKNLSHQQSSTLFWLNLTMSVGLAALTCALAPGIAYLYGDPRLTLLTMALGSTFVFAGLTAQHNSLLLRQMRFTTHASIYLTALVSGVIASIGSAWYGLGYWSLVVGNVVTAVANTVGVWTFSKWVPSWCWNLRDVRRMLGFGANVVGANILTYSTRNLDNALIGWMWGAGPLGIYAKAYQLLMMPILQISLPMTRVAVPTLSRLQDEPVRFRNHYRKALMMMVLLGMPTVAFTFFAAHRVIHVALGSQWGEAVPIFQLLAPAAFFGTFSVATAWVYNSLGLARRQLRWGILTSIVTVSGFAIGLPWGPRGVAASFSITYCLLTMGFPALAYAYRGTPIRVSDFVASVWRPAVSSILAGAVLWAYGNASHFSLPQVMLLLIDMGVYATAYVAICVGLPGGRDFVEEIRDILGELRIKKIRKSESLPEGAVDVSIAKGVTP